LRVETLDKAGDIMNEKETKLILKQKAEYFFGEKSEVHITKINKMFARGLILKIDKDKIMLQERKQGKIPVFFAEMLDISRCIEKEKIPVDEDYPQGSFYQP
jgi:hypothetical protein